MLGTVSGLASRITCPCENPAPNAAVVSVAKKIHGRSLLGVLSVPVATIESWLMSSHCSFDSGRYTSMV
ncbi:MAG: hypothetical protein IPG75_18455 [Gemmatimonadetes bacterium]|nr:hypothetical protein [Gemmatimonadota bacterium]